MLWPILRQSRDTIVPRFTQVLRVLTTAAAMTGLLALAFEHGYYRLPLPLVFLRWCQYGAAGIFLADLAGRFVLAPGPREFFRQCWADLALLGLAAAGLAGYWLIRSLAGLPPEAAGDTLLAVKLYLGGQVVLRAVRVNLTLAHSRVHPARMLLASFAVCILLGAAALKLPRSVPLDADPLTWTDALFTSTSATCVTGLVVRTTGTDQVGGLPEYLANRDLEPAGFAPFGQMVILTLIQVGGLGVMIFGTIVAVMLGRHLSLRQGVAMQDMLASETPGKIGRVVRFIFLFTFVIEAVGATLLYTTYADFDWSVRRKLFYAVFHSVSAFCNAGFSLTPDSLVRYHRYWQVHGVIAPLIVLGGLGFPVLLNLGELLAGRLNPRRSGRSPARLTLHSKMVLSMTGILILGGATGLLLTESPLTEKPRPGTRVGSHTPSSSVVEQAEQARTRADPHQLRQESPGVALADAIFMSITARTAGFNTVDTDYRGQNLSSGSYFLLVVLMMIGGAPASTAGGMKTITLAVLIVTVASVVRRREEVEGFGRALSAEMVKRAATLAACYITLVFLVTMVLAVTEVSRSPDFVQLLFESASGCGTVGLGTGLTAELTRAGRYVIILAMFAGRLGPLTLLIAMMTRGRTTRYRLPHENVMLG